MQRQVVISSKLSLAALITCTFAAAMLPTRAKAEDIAVVVGINQYAHLDHANLSGCVSDAHAVQDSLKKRHYNVILLTDAQATRQAILDKLSEIRSRIHSGDHFVFYFAGHGSHDTSYKCFLLTADAEETNFEHTLGKEDLEQYIGAIPTQKRTVLIDACHAEGALRGKGLVAFRSRYHQLRVAQSRPKRLPNVNQTDNNDQIVDTSFCGFAACLRNQPAGEIDFGDSAHGIFTYYLTQQLDKANVNARWDTVVSRVCSEVAEKMEGQQTPTFGPNVYRSRRVFDSKDDKKVAPGLAPTVHTLWDDYVDNKSNARYVRVIVDPDRSAFQIGDKFDVNIKVGVTGYLILLNKDDSEKVYLLSPDPKITGVEALVKAARVKAGVTRTIHTDGVDRGTERVKALLFHSEADARELLSRFPKDGATQAELLRLQRPQHLPSDSAGEEDDDGNWTYFTSEAQVEILSKSDKDGFEGESHD